MFSFNWVKEIGLKKKFGFRKDEKRDGLHGKWFSNRYMHMIIIDNDIFQMVVMDEVHKQMNDIAAKQKEKIDELNAEIRKLKAMIVKHESRIRTLETKNRELEQTQQFNNNGGAHSEDMDPDEV